MNSKRAYAGVCNECGCVNVRRSDEEGYFVRLDDGTIQYGCYRCSEGWWTGENLIAKWHGADEAKALADFAEIDGAMLAAKEIATDIQSQLGLLTDEQRKDLVQYLYKKIGGAS